ncbi:hypothetical protein QWY82_06755 [Simiduia curdlanivorans]|uniref:Phenylacetate--CoA ligase family protein n=1 Tax=Simiduia curdlanivorans TaxID=1492769 RepID=A0ABV8VA88_9GAMM|nr:hypothetical protein [Simiduia curdlanivorans]MDN3638504.1 hypothetical protein [Simiduia curdlanivorans]
MNSYLSKYFVYYPATILKGESISKHLNAYRNFQYKSKEDIKSSQNLMFQSILKHAKESSEYYKEALKDVDIDKFSLVRDINSVPALSKNQLINSLDKIQSNMSLRYETKTTGGSTGQPVSILKNTDALARERAATWRAYEWAGIGVGDAQGRFWGVPHSAKAKVKASIIDFIANRMRISAFDLDDKSLGNYYKKLLKFRPKYLYGYVSVIEALANHIDSHNLKPLSGLISIITTSEVLYPHARLKIEKCFGIKVFNEYGCGEVGSIAHECKSGNMHVMADNLFVETDSTGEIIVTDFHNLKTPLIRYRTGDFGELSNKPCSCGVTLPLLSKIQGRAYDIIKLNSGRSIHPESLIYVIEDFKKARNVISQFQAIQTSANNLVINIIPKDDWSSNDAHVINNKLLETFDSQLSIDINLVDSIQREPSGKMRVVKSLLL